MADQFVTVDEYIRSFPDDVQIILEKVRRTIRKAVPDAAEKISYQIPTLTLNGLYLVYFAGWRTHVSVYPVPTADAALDRELEPYKSGKGTLRFPFANPIPYDLIARVATVLAGQQRG